MEKAEKTFRVLHPELIEEELKEAEFNMMPYLEAVLKIGERLAAQKKETKDDQPLS